MDRLTALTVFRHVVESGSFAAAARQLGLSAAAASKNVWELEQHLSMRLLNRTTRRMSLTEAGALYYERIALILDDLNEADSALGPLQPGAAWILASQCPGHFDPERIVSSDTRFSGALSGPDFRSPNG